MVYFRGPTVQFLGRIIVKVVYLANFSVPSCSRISSIFSCCGCVSSSPAAVPLVRLALQLVHYSPGAPRSQRAALQSHMFAAKARTMCSASIQSLPHPAVVSIISSNSPFVYGVHICFISRPEISNPSIQLVHMQPSLQHTSHRAFF